MITDQTSRVVLSLLLVAAVCIAAAVMSPFAGTLLVAAVLAAALHPATERLARALRGRRKVASFLVTLGVLLAIIVPVAYLATILVVEVASAFTWVRDAVQSAGMAGLIGELPEPVRGWAERLLAQVPSGLDSIEQLAAAQAGRAAAAVGGILSATGVVLLKTVLALIALYFLLADGRDLVAWLNQAVPLQRGQVSELLGDFRRVTVAVLASTLATAGVQAAAAFAGYLLAGVPNAAFFTFLTFLLALVPAVGATGVVLVLGVLKLATGHKLAGVFLLVWAVAVVSMIDNLVKPVFMRMGIPIHGAVIFFALLGGLAVFGPIGFLVGPLSVAFLLAAVRMWHRANS
jgi:predicted PurR-regulated permease PerM